MCPKCNITGVLLLALLCCSSVRKVNAVCSLEIMKNYAEEACLYLFQEDEYRGKRSVAYELNAIENESEKTKAQYHHDHHHYIARSIYPEGGYLKVNPEHFQILSQVAVLPRYKPKKQPHAHRTRYKRHETMPGYNNLPYCCYNKCKEDFFC